MAPLRHGFVYGAALGVALLAFTTQLDGAAAQGAPQSGDKSSSAKPLFSAHYGGVTAKGGQPPDLPQPPPGVQFITWPGFQVMPGVGSSVFLQLTGPAPYKLYVRGRKVVVTLEKVQVPLKNNLRPVVSRFFPGPVQRFQLRELRGSRAQLELRLDRAKKPEVMMAERDGYTYLTLVFSH